MTTKALVLLGALCIVLCLALVLTPGTAMAQDDMSGSQQKLGTKEWDKDKLPNKWEMAAGFGSIFVMIAVVKWL